MWKNASILIVIVSMLVFNGAAQAQGTRDVTSPQDIVVGVPDDGITTDESTDGWPPNELPPFAIDDQVLTKYLHFKGEVEPTGIRVTPAMGPTVVTGLTFTTANDAIERDPVEYELSGSNVSINGPWTLIHAGPIVDFAGGTAWPRRTQTTTPIQFANTVSYTHYQLMFPTIRDPGSANSMQIAEVELLTPIFKASAPTPGNGATNESTWASLGWTAGAFAESHDVYFSDNLDDVEAGAEAAFQGNLTDAFLIVGFVGFAFPDGLVPGTTYYWRVDEVNDANPNSPWVGDVWSFTVPPPIAWRPFPPDSGIYIDTNADLSWMPGWGAITHTVYFGDNFDDVNNATNGTGGFTTTYELEQLELGKTYYWRVDESDGVTTRKGDVWSFTTDSGGGGIKGEYFNNENVSGMPVLTRIDPDVDFSWAGVGPGSPVRDTEWSARWTADLVILFPDTYTFSVNSEGGTRLWIDGEQVLDMWVSWVPTEYAALPIYLESGIHSLRLEYYHYSNGEQHLYWSTSTMPKEIVPTGTLQTPVRAGNPNPYNGAVDVEQTAILSWLPGHHAASHQVYFGADEEAVRNADTSSPEYKSARDLGNETYDPEGELEWDTTYFWRVDEVNDANPESPWSSLVWSFTTADFLIIDNFEDYNDYEPDRVFDTWADGWDDDTNGSTAGYPDPSFPDGEHFVETEIVHSGYQSMPLFYDNTIAGKSEVIMELTTSRDWTVKGVHTLTIWFRGRLDNVAEPMYVVLNGTAVVVHDNPDAALIDGWVEWNIPLQTFADKGVGLTDVDSIGIGFGDRDNPQPGGGSGSVFFDDIRLYAN